jgi:4-amino-4-deoxy-L-arabinose transferase-like glycosyltransferase
MIARDLALSLAAPALSVPAASALSAALRRARLELDAETHAAAAFALALAWMQAGGMLLLTIGALDATSAGAWLVAGVAVALVAGRGAPLPKLQGWHALLLVPLAVYLLLATVPPWDRDELVYHLALPREMARAGRWVRPDDNIFASVPLGWESAVSLLYALGDHGEPLFDPRLLGAWTAGACALATVGLARSLGARAAWTAGAALLLVPTLVEFGSSAYVEPYLLLLVTLAVGAVARVVAGEPRWTVPAAVLAGLATSVKYSGLAVVAILAGLLLLELVGAAPSARSPVVRRALRFVGVAAVVGCPFYIRNLVQRHNPFFPMAFGIFGGVGWDATRAEAYWETLRQYGAADDALGVVTLPLRVFVARDMERGFQGSVGPLAALGFVACALLLAKGRAHAKPDGAARARAIASLGAFAAAFFLFWMLTVRQARFLLPAIPPLLALVAAGIDRVGRLGARANAGGAALIAAGALWAAEPSAYVWSRQLTTEWITGRFDRDALLARLLPESFPALRALSSLVPFNGRVWLVWTRGYTYYLDRAYRLDPVFEGWRFEALLDRSPDPAAFLAALRADGITHVLVNERFFLRSTSADTEPGRTGRLRGRFAGVVASRVLVEERRWGRTVLFRVTDGDPSLLGAP